MNISLSAFAPENLVSRDGFGSPVPRQPAHLHTQAESGAYLRDSSRVPRRRPFIYLKPPYAIGSIPSLSGHAIAYRWRSLPRVRRHRASKPQGSSERVLPWQVTMDQIICASLSHTHYFGMKRACWKYRKLYYEQMRRVLRGAILPIYLFFVVVFFVVRALCFILFSQYEQRGGDWGGALPGFLFLFSLPCSADHKQAGLATVKKK